MAGPPLTRQIWTLTKKNLRISLQRHWLSTLIRALLAPTIYMFFISYMKNLFVPPSEFGIGTPVPIRGFIDALQASQGGRDTVAFVKNGHNGGQIEDLINYLSVYVTTAGKMVTVLDTEDELLTVCRNSLRGSSSCYGAAVFYSSPTEGESGYWNYTLRADSALGERIYVNRHDNDQEIYVLPFQHAIDLAIVNEFGNGSSSLPDEINEYPYTDMTQQERSDQIRRIYMNAVITILGIAYILGIIGVVYHLVGRMALERELGMSQLIEAMVPNKHRWQTQAVRLLALHFAMDIIWLPSWIVTGVILKVLVYTKTSFGIVVIWQVLSGLAFSSWSILGGSFFSKAQLSGISVIIVSLILAILAQVLTPNGLGSIVILSLLFTPMNYIFTVIDLGRWEHNGQAADLFQSSPPRIGSSEWELPVLTLWVFLLLQIVLYPILGALVERTKYGTASKARKVLFKTSPDSVDAIILRDFQKSYVPSWWSRRVLSLLDSEKKNVVNAVKCLNLKVMRGQILCLLGANGSGKSTTLDAITGLGTVTGGEIIVNGTGGIGYCPQKNVLWDELTVFEHVSIFNRLKSLNKPAGKEDVFDLIRACDLESKILAKAKTLSGGQKRKLQLAMMFAGGSHVCCIDEVSSGLDPLSRRKIWEILLRERNSRSLLLTTHFLDEADVLSDFIVLMSKGDVKAKGSAAELKHRFGGNYRVEVKKPKLVGTGLNEASKFSAEFNASDESYTFECLDSAEVARLLQEIENEGFEDYTVHGPSIESVFLNLCEEAHEEKASETWSWHDATTTTVKEGEEQAEATPIRYVRPKQENFLPASSGSASDGSFPVKNSKGLDLVSGSGTSFVSQTWILFKKRLTVLRRNYIPYVISVALPVVVAGLVTFFLKDFQGLTCSPQAQSSVPDVESFSTETNIFFLAGPTDRANTSIVALLSAMNSSLVRFVNSYDDFQNAITQQYNSIAPGGIYVEDTPTIAYVGNYVLYFAVLMQNILDQILSGQTIATQFKQFAVPFAPSAGHTLQLIFYFGLSMTAFPGFFALYPTRERLQKVRALHYSNGIRAGPLWLAYTCFDFVFVLAVAVLVTAIWLAVSNVWYNMGYVFVVFMLYGLTSSLLSYVFSLYTTSLLASFAWSVGYQAAMFTIYFVAYMTILTFRPAYAIDSDIKLAHFTLALITPSGNLLRSLLLTLNEFSVLCDGNEVAAYPGALDVFGGPILYLIVQACLLFTWLVWYDSGYQFTYLQDCSGLKKFIRRPLNEKRGRGDDNVAEPTPTGLANSGLLVQHIIKSFGEITAVEDITFGVAPSECFALLGPNGAGKSTTISLIRGDLRPDHGDVLIQGASVTSRRMLARKQLGVCPQFDAMDNMTVTEHLRFYGRARGVKEPDHNVDALIAAVNLNEYRDRLAHKLSGGNKRKLSLAIALVGNPAVLLLDEPSSGMDAANKRFLWKALVGVSEGRSMLITTHSLEEADRLANKVGIMATRMLALGTSEELRDKFGENLYVQIALKGAPHVPETKTREVKSWIENHIDGAQVEERLWYGQLRFSVPIRSCGIARLFKILQENQETLDLEYYSVSRATLDQIFLEVITRYKVTEEGTTRHKRKRKWWRAILDDA
ncbi:uncharacterized protein PV09_06258 [Verruconis gallopava]|uniref:ABC transporter domain-containing protein n=1 Tax=Verruconis gallopava TaxID=253628 RepID=A0A0D1YP53_9PEZI|nr:uncharacterized protein PV09_06258 [Verruconis gallopava]KIW02447.1 hypothetical protein PV09_06258 [Verruconis gallopava]